MNMPARTPVMPLGNKCYGGIVTPFGSYLG